MGCSFCKIFDDPIVSGILDKLKSEAKGIIETFIKDKLEAEGEKALKISERKNEFSATKSKNETIEEKKIKEYNTEEFKLDKELVVNDANKTTKLYDVGLKLADELRKQLIKKFTDELKGAPSIAQAALKKKIDELTSFTSSQFYNSSFGKPLKKALEAYGVKASEIEKYVDELIADYKKRREDERKEFGLTTNEFGDDYSEEKLKKLIEEIVKKLTSDE